MSELHTLIFAVLLQQTSSVLGSYIIPNELFDAIQLIAGSKYQYISLQDLGRNSVKDVIQHYFIEGQKSLLGNHTNGNSAVFNGDVKNIKNFGQFEIPNRILITELKSEDDET